MDKKVRIIETETDFIAEFLVGEDVIDYKAIPVVEYDGLLDVVDFENLPVVLDAKELHNDWGNLSFDTDGEPTNFEQMLDELIAR
jgi:glutamate mutase epsilon subunit